MSEEKFKKLLKTWTQSENFVSFYAPPQPYSAAHRALLVCTSLFFFSMEHLALKTSIALFIGFQNVEGLPSPASEPSTLMMMPPTKTSWTPKYRA
jgi:hypothetical protein